MFVGIVRKLYLKEQNNHPLFGIKKDSKFKIGLRCGCVVKSTCFKIGLQFGTVWERGIINVLFVTCVLARGEKSSEFVLSKGLTISPILMGSGISTIDKIRIAKSECSYGRAVKSMCYLLHVCLLARLVKIGARKGRAGVPV